MAEWTRHLMSGNKKPAGMSFKEFMYECFRRDVERGRARNADIPRRPHARSALRVVTFNVHFLSAGYSGVVLRDSEDDVLGVIRELDADVLLLQEVPASRVRPLARRLARELGYAHSVAAGSADVHVLDKAIARHGGERLHAQLFSRWPLRGSAAVPMGSSGHAAYAEVLLPRGPAAAEGAARGAAEGPAVPVAVYSTHLSVRCPPEARRDEMRALLRHAAVRAAARPTVAATIIGGDLNQPSREDYPADEWRAMADDMARAGLPLDDGVRAALRADGFAPSFDVCRTSRVPATSAWNGALLD
eukprot:g7460.t1